MYGFSARPDARQAHQAEPRGRLKILRVWLAVLSLAVLCLVGLMVRFADDHWPYRYRIVKPLLEGVLGSRIEITRYHRTYFPHPGFVAEGLTLRRQSGPDLPPIGSVEQLVVQGRWIDLLLLRQRVQLVDIQQLHIVVPAPGTTARREDFPPGSASDFDGPDTLIEQLKVHHGLLDIMRTNGMRFSFPIQELDIHTFQKGRANTYTVAMENAIPWGRINSTGSFGPFNAQNLGATPVSGTYSFSSVRLSDIGKLHGTLASSGSFVGTLGAIEATGAAQVPDFAVNSGEPTEERGDIRCTVNGLSGEVVIHQVQVRSDATVAEASGGVVGSPKVTNLDIVVSGRSQDVLRPFVHGDVPITGPVLLRSHAYVAPAQEGVGFLRRLRVDGVFDVPAALAANQATEKRLSDFSGRAVKDSAEDPPPNTDVASALQGAAHLRDGIVSSDRLTFQIPGARATLGGTFSFENEVVHLTGNLAMQSGISHAVTGFKSAMLKPLDPFFRRGHAGAVIPIAVTGGPGQYKITQDFLHKK